MALAGTACTGDIEADSTTTDSGAPSADADPNAPDANPSAPDATPRPDAAPIVGEPAALQGITQLHNDERALVGVAALAWDPALAAVAQAWAEQCIDNSAPIGLIDHNAGRSDNYPGYVGENIYGSSGTATAQRAVSSWASEKTDYDYASNSCAPGKACGHYTQVVWSTSERLGCALYNCPGLQYSSSLVCNYSPGGNNGGRPY